MGYIVNFDYQGASATVEVWDDNKTATLATVHSKFRRRGAGRIVLEKAIEYAEVMNFDLLLEVCPFGDEPQMPAPELKAFYISLGFQSRGGGIMGRYSKSTEETDAQPNIE